MIADYTDIIGLKFGKLTVVSYVGKIKRRHKYKCLCECGESIITSRDSLIYKKSYNNRISCGLCDNPYKLQAEKHIGEKWNRLTIKKVIRKPCKRGPKHQYLYECFCDCGGGITLAYHSLTTNHTKSCGCLVSEVSTINGSKNIRWHNKTWYLEEDGVKRFCKSGLEALFAAWLNYNKIKFKYNPKRFYLEGKKSYTPDFYVEEENMYYEIKGLDREIQRANRELFKKDHNLTLLTDYDLIFICNLKINDVYSLYREARKKGIPKEDYIFNYFKEGYNE